MTTRNEGQPVNARPTWAEMLRKMQAEGTQPGELIVDGKPYKFTLVRAGLAPLPYAVGFPEESALFISVDVPEERRPLILAHEVRETTTFSDLPEEQRCRASLEVELEDARNALGDDYPQYLSDRTEFFKELVSLYEQPEQQAAKSPEFRLGIQAASDYLNGLNVEPRIDSQ